MNPTSPFKIATIVLLLFSLVVFNQGCKKSAPGITSFMKYKVNGEQKQYDTCYVTILSQFPNSNPPFYYCSIAGGRYGDNGIICTFYNDNEIAVSKYTEAIFSRTRIPAAILGGYKDADNNLYISWQNGWSDYPVTIDITEVSATYIRGKFSGTMRMVGGTREIAITDGEFLALTNK